VRRSSIVATAVVWCAAGAVVEPPPVVAPPVFRVVAEAASLADTGAPGSRVPARRPPVEAPAGPASPSVPAAAAVPVAAAVAVAVAGRVTPSSARRHRYSGGRLRAGRRG